MVRPTRACTVIRSAGALYGAGPWGLHRKLRHRFTRPLADLASRAPAPLGLACSNPCNMPMIELLRFKDP